MRRLPASRCVISRQRCEPSRRLSNNVAETLRPTHEPRSDHCARDRAGPVRFIERIGMLPFTIYRLLLAGVILVVFL